MRIVPGVLLCAGIGLAGWIVQLAEERLFGRPYVEGLVVAILLGAALATTRELPERFSAGIDFSARQLLELAVCLIGVAIDTQLLRSAGALLFGGVVAIVTISLAATYAIGRMAGLPHRLSVLIAAGNSICGNSAIAAIAPVIGAEPEDVAAAISFTAVLGVAVVLVLPVLAGPGGLSEQQYGVVAGLTVYAVPQVLAATLPVSAAAGAIATVVKLMRVLLLGPLVIGLGLVAHRRSAAPRGQLVPWFIIGFVIVAALRSTGLFSASTIEAIRVVATALTIVAMAGLGLGVDLRTMKRSSGRVVAVVCVSLVLLCGMATVLARAVT
jgi:uncharacterized integral membrane protein (TIGR00698 family)